MAAGTALATAGEDGTVKIWSRNGMLRSTLTQCDSPVYCVVWGWDSDQLCYCSGSNVVVRSIQSSAKQVCVGVGVRGWWLFGGVFIMGDG